jgi:hypothetical protein
MSKPTGGDGVLLLPVVDEVFGPAFIKICAYFPYPVTICLLTKLQVALLRVAG